jgi:hypothetical protein
MRLNKHYAVQLQQQIIGWLLLPKGGIKVISKEVENIFPPKNTTF